MLSFTALGVPFHLGLISLACDAAVLWILVLFGLSFFLSLHDMKIGMAEHIAAVIATAYALCSCIIHELGHYAAATWMGVKTLEIVTSPGGFWTVYDFPVLPMPARLDLILSAGGPLAQLLFALPPLAAAQTAGTISGRAVLRATAFAITLLVLHNMSPVGGFDGHKILAALRTLW